MISILQSYCLYLNSFVCCLVAKLCPTLWDPMDCSKPDFCVPHRLPEFAQVHAHCIGDVIQISHLLSPSYSAFNLSQPIVFSDELALCIRWPKYWSFSFSINPSKEYSGLVSFKIGIISLLLKELSSLLQYHSSKASILWCSALFMVQLSQPYTTTGKTIGLTLIVIECFSLGLWTKLWRAYWTPSWAPYSNTDSSRPSVCCCSSLPLSWPSQNGQTPQVLGLLLKVTLLQILALFSVIILLTLSSNIFKITYLVMFFWLLPGVWVAYHIIYHCWKLIFPPHLIMTNSIFNPWILKE